MTMKIGNNELTRKKVVALVLALIICVVAAILSPFILTGAPEDGLVKVRRGSTLEMVSDSLQSTIGTAFGRRVVTLLRLTGSDMTERHGAFQVNKGDSPFRVMRLLRSGQPSGIKFTFNNVRTRDEWAARVGDRFMMSKDEMLRALNDSALCAKYGKTVDNVTAMLLPDSYEFYWDITPEQMLDRMHDYYDKFWTGDRKAKAQALGLTPEQVSTIASIVDEETGKADERGKVARLYLNRVATGMPLQADPTVKFAIGDFSIRRITYEMTRTSSPYNTYRNPGIPPGPIRLPEKSTLDAVLNAPQHDYIYMCAKEDFSGYHNFTASYAEHMANAHRYQTALNARGVK
ncbi:MAG: endolytic transglycosylase MltG [Muribaculaceae bacterium]|nr:endolytic transglycosylase MltG [Muribaculaceae bacterium]